MRFSILISLMFWLLPLHAQDITGLWHTVDDETGEVKSIVEIYQQDDKYFGQVRHLLLKPADTLCTKCKGEDKDQPIVGMVILKDLEKKDELYTGGSILDPAKGKVYRSRAWLEEGNLQVRGYLGLFYRTQTWYRAEGE